MCSIQYSGLDAKVAASGENTRFTVPQNFQWCGNLVKKAAWSTMRREALQKSQEALDDALKDLETTRMIPPDDPKLSALKGDIREAIEKPPARKRKSGKASLPE